MGGGLGTRSRNASIPAKRLARLTCRGHGHQRYLYQGCQFMFMPGTLAVGSRADSAAGSGRGCNEDQAGEDFRLQRKLNQSHSSDQNHAPFP